MSHLELELEGSMEGHLLMSHQELERKRVLEQVLEGRLTLQKASELLKLSYRQTLRVYERFKESGAKGLIHRSRGRSSNRRFPEAFRRKVLRRYQERYEPLELGPTLVAEKLAAEDLKVDHETLRRWLIADGHWVKRRKRAKHRTRRERRHHFGELVQMDGSHHAWFGADKPKACLMHMVDDATGVGLAFVAEQETTEAAMKTLWLWIERYGVPQALYTDKKNVFVSDREPTLEEQLAGEHPLTEFARACKKLGIGIITANSPQAKGRVERKHGVLQDRFLAELALRGIKTIPSANKILQQGFMDELNAKFAIEPISPEDFHRPVPASVNLADVFCFEVQRTLTNDWTIRHKNRYYQITKDNKPLPRPKDKILMRWRLNGELVLLYKNKPLQFNAFTPRQFERYDNKQRPIVPDRPPASSKKTGSPWKQNCTLMFADTGE